MLWGDARLQFYVPELDFYAFTIDVSMLRGPINSYAATPMAVCDLPDAARLEADVVWLGDWEDDPAAAVAAHGATTELTRAGDCVWVGPALSVTVPDSPSGSGGSALTVYCRAYEPTTPRAICWPSTTLMPDERRYSHVPPVCPVL